MFRISCTIFILFFSLESFACEVVVTIAGNQLNLEQVIKMERAYLSRESSIAQSMNEEAREQMAKDAIARAEHTNKIYQLFLAEPGIEACKADLKKLGQIQLRQLSFAKMVKTLGPQCVEGNEDISQNFFVQFDDCADCNAHQEIDQKILSENTTLQLQSILDNMTQYGDLSADKVDDRQSLVDQNLNLSNELWSSEVNKDQENLESNRQRVLFSFAKLNKETPSERSKRRHLFQSNEIALLENFTNAHALFRDMFMEAQGNNIRAYVSHYLKNVPAAKTFLTSERKVSPAKKQALINQVKTKFCPSMGQKPATSGVNAATRRDFAQSLCEQELEQVIESSIDKYNDSGFQQRREVTEIRDHMLHQIDKMNKSVGSINSSIPLKYKIKVDSIPSDYSGQKAFVTLIPDMEDENTRMSFEALNGQFKELSPMDQTLMLSDPKKFNAHLKPEDAGVKVEINKADINSIAAMKNKNDPAIIAKLQKRLDEMNVSYKIPTYEKEGIEDSLTSFDTNVGRKIDQYTQDLNQYGDNLAKEFYRVFTNGITPVAHQENAILKYEEAIGSALTLAELDKSLLNQTLMNHPQHISEVCKLLSQANYIKEFEEKQAKIVRNLSIGLGVGTLGFMAAGGVSAAIVGRVAFGASRAGTLLQVATAGTGLGASAFTIMDYANIRNKTAAQTTLLGNARSLNLQGRISDDEYKEYEEKVKKLQNEEKWASRLLVLELFAISDAYDLFKYSSKLADHAMYDKTAKILKQIKQNPSKEIQLKKSFQKLAKDKEFLKLVKESTGKDPKSQIPILVAKYFNRLEDNLSSTEYLTEARKIFDSPEVLVNTQKSRNVASTSNKLSKGEDLNDEIALMTRSRVDEMADEFDQIADDLVEQGIMDRRSFSCLSRKDKAEFIHFYNKFTKSGVQACPNILTCKI